MDDDVVEAMTDKILGNLPNTYAFTKALSEGLVEEAMPYIPAVILRYLWIASDFPVDIAVNAILTASWNFLYCKEHEKRVYNLTSSSDFKVMIITILLLKQKISPPTINIFLIK